MDHLVAQTMVRGHSTKKSDCGQSSGFHHARGSKDRRQSCFVGGRLCCFGVPRANRMGPSAAGPGPTTHRTLGARSQPSAAGMPPGTWEQLDFMHAEDLFFKEIPMLRSCPKFLRGRLREGFACALRERFRAKQVGDEVGERRAWKLFALIPLMLLHRLRSTGSVGRDELARS